MMKRNIKIDSIKDLIKYLTIFITLNVLIMTIMWNIKKISGIDFQILNKD